MAETGALEVYSAAIAVNGVIDVEGWLQQDAFRDEIVAEQWLA